eukprot:TRINITY_DN14879_c0_g1_i2.p1 TRINITY_DN14879_c0_g1~~TRINITY_DN14879_c0_g1_i2.p1  ORF type:complete len:386 (+),score=49.21 TRINITY_DN14879_c0_g1_i2:1022-2179(+)
MHGHYRVIRDLKYAQVDGLVHVDVTDDGGLRSTADADGIKRCKNTCMSLVNCQIWIYSRSHGCWMERPNKHRIQYPATFRSWGIGSSSDIVAGEFVQRVCGDLSGSDAPALPPAPTDTVPPIPEGQPAVPTSPMCPTSNKVALTVACTCESNANSSDCAAGMFCWDGNTCSSSAKPDPRTLPDDVDTSSPATNPVPVLAQTSERTQILVLVCGILLVVVCSSLAIAGLLSMTVSFSSRAPHHASKQGSAVAPLVDEEDATALYPHAAPVKRGVVLVEEEEPGSSRLPPSSAAAQHLLPVMYTPMRPVKQMHPGQAQHVVYSGYPPLASCPGVPSASAAMLPTLRLGGVRSSSSGQGCACGSGAPKLAGGVCSKCAQLPRSSSEHI